MHDLIKGNFIPSKLHASCEQLSRKLYDRMVGTVTNNDGFQMDLLVLVKSIMFPAVVSHLFGDEILPEGKVCGLFRAGLEHQRLNTVLATFE